ncbi:MAG: binding protein with helix-turn-helix domain [Nocardia sp.]|uniref:helix-turn-helix domain-containing protein n=1 Tax=Nocardia sp. TaxID=1821 RepID=UPI00262ACA30|nr:helix-turn-helix transcriptional regulator [Nocardia sp.]MCU1645406.1 binding protein with helix-turn-helix domain [Nocardia sp.]
MDQARAIWNTPAVRTAAESGDYGAVVRAVRRATNLTLAELAELCSYSISSLSRLERGKQHLGDVRVLRSLADALDIPPHLLGLANTPPQTVRPRRPAAIVGVISAPDEESEPMRRRTLLTGLTGLAGAATLGTSALPSAIGNPLTGLEHVLLVPPSTGNPVGLPRLGHDLAAVRSSFDLGRYADVAADLPNLLCNALATVAAADSGDDIGATNAVLAQIYVLASTVTVKFAHNQLAWTTADRAMQAAHISGDTLTQAAAHRAWAIVLRRTGHADTGTRLVVDTAASLQSNLHRGPQYLSVYGSLLSTAAYTAAVDGDRATAHTLIGEAIEAATRLDNDANSSRTGFSSTTVGLYRISIARVLGDSGTAIEVARQINPATIASRERRAQYWSDVARAFHQWGKPEACYRALLAAEQTSPDEVRYRKQIQHITRSLLRDPAATSLPGVQAFALRTGTKGAAR